MARAWIKPSHLTRAVEDLRAIADTLERAERLMTGADVPHLLLHGDNYLGTVVPQMVTWSTRLEADARLGVRSAVSGETSQAEREVFKRHGEVPPPPAVTPKKKGKS